jgi:polyhydroxyalkanoate synthesis regulator phasin
MGTRNIRRMVAGAALAGAIGVGGLTVAAVNPLGIAGAQDGSTTTTTVAGQPDPSTQPQQGAAQQGPRAKVVQDALASLVADGTITQAQSDAVAARLKETAKAARQEHKANRTERRQQMVAVAAKALGMSADDLTAALKDGKTLKQVAESRDVEPQKVIDALVGAANERVDAAVSSGKLDAARADRVKERAATRIERLVNDGARRRGGN